MNENDYDYDYEEHTVQVHLGIPASIKSAPHILVKPIKYIPLEIAKK